MRPFYTRARFSGALPLLELRGDSSIRMAPSLCIPVNVEFAALLFSGILVAYTLRVNISVAAQQMRTELNWTEDQKGLVLSAFYWGYALGQLPASYFAMFNGARVIFGLSVFIPSVLTLLFPVAAETNFTLALFVRMMIGLVEACCFPSVFHFFPHWVPEQDKTFMVPAILSGVYLGEMIAFFFSGMIIDESYVTQGGYEILGWRGAFYIFGLIGVAWFPVWMYLGYERPEDHPRMTTEELSYIQRGYPHELLPSEEEEEGGTGGADAEEDGKDWYGSRQVYGARDRDRERGREKSVGGRERAPSGTFGERLLRSSNETPPTGLVGSLQQPLLSSLVRGDAENIVMTNPMLSSSSAAPTGVHSRQTSTASSTHSALAAAVLAPVGINGPARREDAEHGPPTLRAVFSAVPWTLIFSSPAMLTLFLASGVNGYIGFLLLSEMPSYLTDELGFDLASAGYLCVAPYAALFVSSLCFGSIFYSMQSRYGWTTRTVRQVSQFTAFGGSSVALLICGFVGNRWVAYSGLILAQGLLGASQSGLACCYLDICPVFSPQLNTVGNTISALLGIVGPIVVSKLLTAFPGEWGWRCVFLGTTGLSVVSLFFWRVYQTSDIDHKINTPTSKSFLPERKQKP